ncbi:MAG: recombinase family protein [Clostridiaceae bacterium]|nr:recombinase family protein [Eubacteriales bacterium]
MNIGDYTKTQNNLINTETELIASQQDEHADTLAITEEHVTVEMNNPWRPQDADREYIKQNIRRRVRNASVTGNAVFIRAKPKPTIQDGENKSVAVYARVSTKSTEQVSSIENQTKYYTEKIEKTPNWEMQEIYSDEGKSGTSMRKRTEFRRMLQAAADKKMDLILCASVSRFSRNVSDCIEQVRMLKTTNPSHPVGVYFETENIYTLDPDSSQMLSIHAMLADWESANKSRRMILSYDQRICTGQYPVLDLLGFRHTPDGDLIIEEDEAITVRFIYLAYICGCSCEEIADILTEKERKTLKGRTVWNANMVRNIMRNERRWGDLNARKTIVVDYVKGKTVKNTQIRDAAFVPGHHKGIVTPEIAKAAHLVAASGRKLDGGVPDISVIDKGALKGFVSVCPAWEGINNDAFVEVCREVYTDEEYDQLTYEARVMNGEEHSAVLSMELIGYEVPRGISFLTRNHPSLTISTKSIRFNAASHQRLGHNRFIEILYHPILQALALRACAENHPNAIRWESDGGKEIPTLSANAFTKAIYDKMEWMRKYSFRFRGLTRERGDGRILLFFLDEPQIFVGRKERTTAGESSQSGYVQYIPYKESKISVEANTDEAANVYAYPDSWERSHIGVSYALRKRRDRLADLLTEQDITEKGVIVENPMIGSIPSREQMLKELDQLLLSM